MVQSLKNTMTRNERIDAIIARDGPGCFMPGCERPLPREEITFDHWNPQANGGTWAIENLRIMHKRCNSLKGDRIPNPDGTLPSLPRELRPRAVDKSLRVEVCSLCESGRLLFADEECPVCGSGPQPSRWPKYAQRTPKECDHSMFHCWMCVAIYPELRQPAFVQVFDIGDG